MLIGITGDLGSGKTMSGAIIGSFLSRQMEVPLYSNFRMKGSKTIGTMREVWNLDQCVFVWDEMWLTADSRLWKDNIGLTRFMMMTRKKGVIIIYTAQMFDMIEKRVRGITDYLIICEKRKEGIWLSFLHMYSGTIGRRYLIPEPSNFYGLYDTFEVMTPMMN